jgi:hypothetical protein
VRYAAGATMPGMRTHDYWLYSVGLIFVTVLVIVA